MGNRTCLCFFVRRLWSDIFEMSVRHILYEPNVGVQFRRMIIKRGVAVLVYDLESYGRQE